MNSRLRRHYDANRRRGIHPVRTTITLPAEAVRYARRRAVEGHQLRGYGRYDLPLLASYSRSGTNWVRYAIESISGRPTPGQVRVHHGADFIIDRAHQAYPVMARYPAVILVLRDYRECLLRHHQGLWEHSRSVTEFLENVEVNQPPFWFIRNIEAFDHFGGPKLLVYYEELIADPRREITRVGQFLSLDATRIAGFNADVETRFTESVDSYTSKGHASQSTASRALNHHARKLLPHERTEFDDFYRRNHPALFAQYLSRYASST